MAMSRRRSVTLAVTLLSISLAALAARAADDDRGIHNGSFEEKGDGIPSWSLAQGARTNGSGASVVDVDHEVAADGRASLRLTGTDGTAIWQLVEQAIDARPGDRVLVTFKGRSRGVAQSSGQYANANLLLAFRGGDGGNLGLLVSPRFFGDRDWTAAAVHGVVPARAKSVVVGGFLSMTGTLWIDDLDVRVAPAAPVSRAARELLCDALEQHLRTTYPFWDMAGRPSADAFFAAKERAALLTADGEDAAVDALVAWLALLHDVHVNVTSPAGRWPTVPGNDAKPNWDDAAIRAALTEVYSDRRGIAVARIGEGDDAIGYVRLDTLQMKPEDQIRAEAAFDRLAGMRSVILDVRRNGGGDEPFAARLLGRFVTEPVIYARQRFRDPLQAGTAGFGPAQDRVLQPNEAGPWKDTRLFVLQGPYCVSSTEGLLLMAEAAPRVTTLGLPSRGASGNPAPFPLWPGASVTLSRWQSLDLEGHCIEGAGVPPDVEVAHVPTPQNPDPALAAAIERARSE